MRRYAKHLEIVEYVRFDTGKPRPCRRRIVRFNGKRDVLVLYKPVVPFGCFVLMPFYDIVSFTVATTITGIPASLSATLHPF